MDDTVAAQSMEALGQEKRLAIFRLLVRAGDDGLPVGRVQKALDIPGSTLTYHLGFLVRAGLVRQERAGREIRCRVDFAATRAMVEHLTAECCEGVCVADDDTATAAEDAA